MVKKIISISFVFMLILNHATFGQDYSGKIVLKVTGFNAHALDELFPELYENDDREAVAKSVFAVPYSTLLQNAKAKGVIAESFEISLFISPEAFRMDMPSPMGSISQIHRFGEQKSYNVMWNKKQYMVMDYTRMREMREGVKESFDDPLAYLKTLPEEQRAEALKNLPPEVLQKLKQHQPELPSTPEKESLNVVSTGKTVKINNLQCKEYRITKENTITAGWFAPAPEGLNRTMQKMKNSFKMMGDEDAGGQVWAVVPGHMPVYIQEFQFSEFKQAEYQLTRMISIDEGGVAPGKFQIPDDFQETSMLEMMNMGRGKTIDD